jgi:phage terminase large subunit-like protein
MSHKKSNNTSINEKPIYIQYAEDAVNGNIVVCELVKLSCQRFLDDLKRDDLIFDYEAVNKCISFIKVLKHFTGKSSGKNFILQPWQQFIVANIVGFYWKETGDRRFTSSYIEISRKNGKTALAAALCMYFLIADGEDGAEVDLAANSKEQAKIAFSFCSNFAKQLDPKGKYIKPYRDTINLNLNSSKLRVFSSDDSKLDGFNASFALLDEYHSAPNSKVRDVIKSSMGMRRNPHLCTITTAGFNKVLPCYKLRSTGIEILQKIKTDDSFFVIVFSLDDTDDWTNENVWVKSSPNLDITVTKKYLKEQIQSAINNPSEEVGVKTKNLNVWCDSIEVWISDNYINNCTATVDINDFSDCECFIGVDLAAVSDITAVCYLLLKEDDEKLYFKTDYYLPETMLIESPNRELYKHWLRTGQLKITSGNVTDYDYITNDMMKCYDNLLIRKISYDSWNSTQWAITATELGLPLEPYSQSIGNFNKPTRELERLIKQGKLVIDNNEITRWMFRNVALKSDHNGNVKPNKGNGKDKKIDGIIAMIEALGGYLDTPRFSGGITII